MKATVCIIIRYTLRSLGSSLLKSFFPSQTIEALWPLCPLEFSPSFLGIQTTSHQKQGCISFFSFLYLLMKRQSKIAKLKDKICWAHSDQRTSPSALPEGSSRHLGSLPNLSQERAADRSLPQIHISPWTCFLSTHPIFPKPSPFTPTASDRECANGLMADLRKLP